MNVKTFGLLYEPDLAVTKDRATLYVGKSRLSPTTLTRFSVDQAGLTQFDVSGNADSFGAQQVTLYGTTNMFSLGLEVFSDEPQERSRQV